MGTCVSTTPAASDISIWLAAWIPPRPGVRDHPAVAATFGAMYILQGIAWKVMEKGRSWTRRVTRRKLVFMTRGQPGQALRHKTTTIIDEQHHFPPRYFSRPHLFAIPTTCPARYSQATNP